MNEFMLLIACLVTFLLARYLTNSLSRPWIYYTRIFICIFFSFFIWFTETDGEVTNQLGPKMLIQAVLLTSIFRNFLSLKNYKRERNPG